MTVSFMIGRFQPFHKGHVSAVKYIYKQSDKVIIGIGSALESHTINNPFTAGERLEMILIAIKEEKMPIEHFLIIPIPDAPYHKEWISIVETLTPRFDIVFSNDPLTQILFLEAGYKVKGIPLVKRFIYSGEEFRRRVINGENWKEIVSDGVAKYLLDNNLINRLRKLVETDKPFKKQTVKG